MDFSQWTVLELRDFLRKKGLSQTGLKSQLIQRCEGDQAEKKKKRKAEEDTTDSAEASTYPLSSISKSNHRNKSSRSQFHPLTVLELRAFLRGHGERTSGSKAQLIQRCIQIERETKEERDKESASNVSAEIERLRNELKRACLLRVYSLWKKRFISDKRAQADASFRASGRQSILLDDEMEEEEEEIDNSPFTLTDETDEDGCFEDHDHVLQLLHLHLLLLPVSSSPSPS